MVQQGYRLMCLAVWQYNKSHLTHLAEQTSSALHFWKLGMVPDMVLMSAVKPFSSAAQHLSDWLSTSVNYDLFLMKGLSFC